MMRGVVLNLFLVGSLLFLTARAKNDCSPPFSQFSTGCYFFSSQTKNWWEAAENCRNHDSFLATIESEAEDNLLKDQVRKLNRGDFWLGGFDLGHEGRWLWESSQKPFLYTVWAYDEPSNSGDKEHCLTLYGGKDYGWNDDVCDKKFYYVCQKMEASPEPEVQMPVCPPVQVTCQCTSKCVSCPPRFSQLASGCFLYSDTLTANWTEADAICRALGGRLAEVHSTSQWLQLLEFYRERTGNVLAPPIVWLGGSDGEEEGSWKWKESGQSLSVSFWAPLQPDDNLHSEDCLAMSESSWLDSSCASHLPFLCQAETKEGPCPGI